MVTRDDLVVHINSSLPCTPENTVVEVRLSAGCRMEVGPKTIRTQGLNAISTAEQLLKERVMRLIYGDIRKAIGKCRYEAFMALGQCNAAEQLDKAFRPLLELLE